MNLERFPMMDVELVPSRMDRTICAAENVEGLLLLLLLTSVV